MFPVDASKKEQMEGDFEWDKTSRGQEEFEILKIKAWNCTNFCGFCCMLQAKLEFSVARIMILTQKKEYGDLSSSNKQELGQHQQT